MRGLHNVEARVTRWTQSPVVLRNVSQVLRELAPVIKLGNNVFVFKHADVLATLSADTDFGVTPNYARKMSSTSGAFFLGMEDGPRYHREESFARRAYLPGDAARVRALVHKTASERLDGVRERGSMDFVADFATHIPLALVRDYFGVPGPSPQILQRWMRALFWYLFLDFANDESIREQAEAAASELRPHLQMRISEIRGRGGEDSFLGRLVALQQDPKLELDELAIMRNIGGIIIGATATQAKAMSLALQELLARPDVLQTAQEIARSDADDEALAGYVFEALRFNPHNPLVVRHAMRPTTIARGTLHERKVRTGARIFALTLSASFDAKGFRDPQRFDPSRRYQDHLHFGYGLHRCFGAQLVKIVLPAALREVLKLEGLHSVGKPALAIGWKGPFPAKFPLRFSPPAARPRAALT